MEKEHILNEISRTAAANGGAPLGEARFEAETGIKRPDWYGVYWARWGDAVREAGFSPNELTAAFEANYLLEQYARFAQELGRLPSAGDLRLKRRRASDFPSWNTFARFGTKAELVTKLCDYCRSHQGFEGVVELCLKYLHSTKTPATPDKTPPAEVAIGEVYLMKAGRYYKIGHSNSAGRREYELSIQLPERPNLVHVIRTDDPLGIEEYWHKRFAAKRMNGEWFDLNAGDIAAFKRRKTM
jgi:hypothetical protein